jgi:hypothetical protein
MADRVGAEEALGDDGEESGYPGSLNHSYLPRQGIEDTNQIIPCILKGKAEPFSVVRMTLALSRPTSGTSTRTASPRPGDVLSGKITSAPLREASPIVQSDHPDARASS